MWMSGNHTIIVYYLIECHEKDNHYKLFNIILCPCQNVRSWRDTSFNIMTVKTRNLRIPYCTYFAENACFIKCMCAVLEKRRDFCCKLRKYRTSVSVLLYPYHTMTSVRLVVNYAKYNFILHKRFIFIFF
jgi:hypothetical protein